MIEIELKDLLEKNFNCTKLEIVNESHLHAGHTNAPTTEDSHFKIFLTSPDFNGLSRIEQQRLVFHTLSDFFEGKIHALSLELKGDYQK